MPLHHSIILAILSAPTQPAVEPDTASAFPDVQRDSAPAEVAPAPQTTADSGDITPAQPPSSTLQELDAGAPVEGAELWRDPFGELGRASRELEKSTGLKIGFAYTALFQQVFGGAGSPSGAGGDVDLLMKWTLLGRATQVAAEALASGRSVVDIVRERKWLDEKKLRAALDTDNLIGRRAR